MGQLIGPLIPGFTGNISWRFPFWIGEAIEGVGLPFVRVIPETYRPILEERQKTQVTRQESATRPNTSHLHGSPTTALKQILVRPFDMLVQEPIVLFTSLFLAVVYAIRYLLFQAYSIILRGKLIST
jgi:MFS family permease